MSGNNPSRILRDDYMYVDVCVQRRRVRWREDVKASHELGDNCATLIFFFNLDLFIFLE